MQNIFSRTFHWRFFFYTYSATDLFTSFRQRFFYTHFTQIFLTPLHWNSMTFQQMSRINNSRPNLRLFYFKFEDFGGFLGPVQNPGHGAGTKGGQVWGAFNSPWRGLCRREQNLPWQWLVACSSAPVVSSGSHRPGSRLPDPYPVCLWCATQLHL